MSGRDRNVNEVTVTGDYTVPLDMDYVYVNATSGAVAITLKRTKDRLIRRHCVQKIDSSANVVTVSDGTLSYGLAVQNEAAAFEQDSVGLFHVFAGNSNPSGGFISEADLSFTDITTADATAAKHGLLPKLSGVAADALRGDGSYSDVVDAIVSADNVIPRFDGIAGQFQGSGWTINDSHALNPNTDNVSDIGNGLVNPRDVNASRKVVVGKATVATAQIDLAGTTSGVISVTVADAAGTRTLTIPDPGVASRFVLEETPVVASADGAVAIKSGVAVITKAGVAVLTIADPVVTTDDFKRLTVISATANAHTLSNAAGSGFNGGGAAADIGTFGGAAGDNIVLLAYQGVWYVVSKVNVTLA